MNDLWVIFFFRRLKAIVIRRFQKVNKWGELGNDLMSAFEKYQNFHNGCDSLDELGARGFVEYTGEDESFLNWKDGYSTLTDFLRVSHRY